MWTSTATPNDWDADPDDRKHDRGFSKVMHCAPDVLESLGGPDKKRGRMNEKGWTYYQELLTKRRDPPEQLHGKDESGSVDRSRADSSMVEIILARRISWSQMCPSVDRSLGNLPMWYVSDKATAIHLADQVWQAGPPSLHAA